MDGNVGRSWIHFHSFTGCWLVFSNFALKYINHFVSQTRQRSSAKRASCASYLHLHICPDASHYFCFDLNLLWSKTIRSNNHTHSFRVCLSSSDKTCHHKNLEFEVTPVSKTSAPPPYKPVRLKGGFCLHLDRVETMRCFWEFKLTELQGHFQQVWIWIKSGFRLCDFSGLQEYYLSHCTRWSQ